MHMEYSHCFQYERSWLYGQPLWGAAVLEAARYRTKGLNEQAVLGFTGNLFQGKLEGFGSFTLKTYMYAHHF